MADTADDARFWDKIARKYAKDPIKDMAGYERTIDRVESFLKPEDTVLEIGCGTGTTALRLAPKVRQLLATDASSEMIAIAREKAGAMARSSIEFKVAAVGDLPWGEGTFDVVLAFNVLHLIQDRHAVLDRVARLLKPGGLFISKTPCLSEMNPLIRLAVPIAQWFGKAPHVSFFSARQLGADIAASGFSLVERARHGTKRNESRVFIVARKRMFVRAPAGSADDDARQHAMSAA